MLSFRKAKQIAVTKDKNGNVTSYGTKDAKGSQKDYEKKVKEFLTYCIAFEKELVEKHKEGKLKTVQNIGECFDEGFKNYYKKSKKYSLFSHTTKILKGMDKNIKKLKDVELNKDNVVRTVENIFKYDRSKKTKGDFIKRSAIDDEAVWKFFNSKIPTLIKKIIFENEELEELKEQNEQKRLMVFINKVLKEVKNTEKKVDNLQENIENNMQKADKQDEIIDELEGRQQQAEEAVENKGNDYLKEDVAKVGDRIEDHKGENKENIEELEQIGTELGKLRTDLQTLIYCLNETKKMKNGEKIGYEDVGKKLKEELHFENYTEVNGALSEEFEKRAGEVKKRYAELSKRHDELDKLIKSTEKGVSAVEKEVGAIEDNL